jgi:RNA polymerase sigma-70 factor (ECF subfamily)
VNGIAHRAHESIVVTRAGVQPLGPAAQPAAARQVGTVSSVGDFDTVYSQHVGFVWRVLRGMGVPDAGVEDAVQDVFVVVHRRLSEFDGRHAVRTWLFAIAYRVAADHRRRARRLRAHEPLPEQFGDRGPTPADSAERAERLRVLDALLSELDDEKRAVLVLAEIEGMTAPEIATVTGASLNTVYTRLRRARLQLSRALAARQKRTS